MNIRVVGLIALFTCLCDASAVAAHPDQDSVAATPQSFTPLVMPSMHIPFTRHPVEIDGLIEESAWSNAARSSHFTEITPGNQIEPIVTTEVLVTHDDRHLYIAFRCFDDPESIRASFRQRDSMFEDDWVGIVMDTFGDASNAYEIFVNPLGVQGDLMMSPGGNEDPAFDLIYHTAGRITDAGYEVEMAIPYASLRFPNHELQEWNITFLRNHPREARRLYSWATLDPNNACLMCQLGSIAGIENVRAGTKLQVLPGIVGFHSRALSDSEDPASGYDLTTFRAEPSLNLRYDVTSSLAAEATINPDFSQIESDAAQIDVNSTFALFYPERRPFFQEGAELFNSQLAVVYTRSINNPIGAAKLTGRAGGTRVAFLSAVDADTPLLLPFEERSEVAELGRSVSNILRVRHTFGTNSYAGATITDRRILDGGAGSVAAAEFQVQFLKQYSLQAEAAYSATEEPDGGYEPDEDEPLLISGTDHTAALDGERFGGYATALELDRTGRHWNAEAIYRSINPTFRTANGFATRSGFHYFSLFNMYRMYPKSRVVDTVAPFFNLERRTNFRGEPMFESARGALNLNMAGLTYFHTSYRLSRERFEGIDFNALWTWATEVNTSFRRDVGLGFYLYLGRGIARNEDVPQKGRFFETGGFVNVKPTSRLQIRPSINFAQMLRLDSDEAFFRGFILRTQANYQFTRELSLRLVTQYDSFNEQFGVEPLLAYQINPFTVVYAGSTHGYGIYDAPYGTREASRQVFFKVQYLFQR